MSVSKLCILRLSAIGDVCHAAAMVQYIQQHSPTTDITWVIGKVEYQLMKGMLGINFIVYDKRGGKSALAEFKQTMSAYQFDALLIMQVALRANLLSRHIKAARRIGFDWARSKEGHWWFVNERIAPQQHAHVLEGFMAFAKRWLNKDFEQNATPLSLSSKTVTSFNASLNNENLSWSVPIEQHDVDFAQQLLGAQQTYAVISPAASKAERNYSADGYAKIADYLCAKGINVILCGGPGALDKNISDQIMHLSANISHNLVGKTSLKQMLYILTNARVVIAPDTGPAHMATMVRTPVIGLYAHSNPRRTGPYLSLDNVVSVYDQCIEQQKGKPWDALPWGARAKGTSLMQLIKIEDIQFRIDQLLAK